MPFSFHEGLPEGLKQNFDPGIFHDPKHLALQAASGWNSFYVKLDNAIEGIVHFHIREDNAASPYRSPFGSFLFSEEVDESTLTEFIAYTENQLKSKNVNSVVIKNQPELYATKNKLLTNVLSKLDYSIAREETSAVIFVTRKPFESGLHKSEKKRLRKCREAELAFERMPLEQLQKIYVFLEACREEKGYSLSMSFDEITKLAQNFPGRIILTTVIDKNQIVAANISIRAYNHVLYNFYHDHAGEYDHLSPVVLLNEGLYQLCQNEGIQFLDLGTSNIGDALNESLLNFKLNLGAQPSRKITFTKMIG